MICTELLPRCRSVCPAWESIVWTFHRSSCSCCVSMAAMLALRRVFSQPPAVSPDLDEAAARAVSWAIAPNAYDRPATALMYAEYLDTLV